MLLKVKDTKNFFFVNSNKKVKIENRSYPTYKDIGLNDNTTYFAIKTNKKQKQIEVLIGYKFHKLDCIEVFFNNQLMWVDKNKFESF